MINAIQTALSGLFAASRKIEASASNIANLQTVGSLDDPDNKPYTPLTTKQTTVTDTNGTGLGVKSEFVPKDPPFVSVFSPDSPFADENGIIGIPNVNLAEEAVNIQLAKVAFKANLKIIEAAKEMSDALLRTFDKKV